MRILKNIFVALMGINRSMVAMLMLALTFTACEYDNEWSPYKSSATLRDSYVAYQVTTVSGVTNGDPTFTWTLQVVSGGDFCTPVTRAGFVGQPFSLNFARNDSEEVRSAEIRIAFSDGYNKSFVVRQLPKTETPEYDRPWAEQPEYREGVSLVHKTYFTTLSNGNYVRNYSVCYDTDKICARWVAYPAHSIYTQGRSYQVGGTTAGRTNAWAFDDAVTQYKASESWSTAYEILSTYNSSLDTYNTYTDPIIPQSKQADIRFNSGIGGGYARGHMLPSADRYNTWNTNAQTCYSTNIMAQHYDFNSGSWAILENKARSKVVADTLFVVVGTLFENTKTVSKNGRTISVPSHCYKLLLRTKSGNTRKHIADIKSADDLMCIGFLFENNSVGENTSLSSAAVPVAEIEQRSGFKFFRNLAPEIADEVKAQKNLKDWGL